MPDGSGCNTCVFTALSYFVVPGEAQLRYNAIDMGAELILHNCVFPLGDPSHDALAVSCGRIKAVGKQRDVFRLRHEGTETVDLSGRAVLPGFFDAHTHFVQTGLERTYFADLTTTRSLSEALDVLSAAARDRPGQWVVGRGWDESRWPQGRYLERQDLDRAIPRQPCCAVRVDGHLVSCNTLGLAHCKAPEGDLVDRERGHLREGPAWELLAGIRLELEEQVEALAEASRHAAALGITSVAEMGGGGTFKAYRAAHRRGLLQTRAFLYLPGESLDALSSLGIERGFGDDRLRLSGLKVFLDGSVGAASAALMEPYIGGQDRGSLLVEGGELAKLWRAAGQAGLQLAVHAIGDRAIEAAIGAASAAGVVKEERHRLEHLELATPEQLDRMAELGLVASMQPNFVANWSGRGGMYERRVGPERDARIDPHGWVLERGIPLAFGSDGMPMGPLAGVAAVLQPPYEPQRVALEDALRAYTSGAAYAVFADEELGRVAKGFRADLVVLSGDPGTTPSEHIRVEMTFLGGRRVFEHR